MSKKALYPASYRKSAELAIQLGKLYKAEHGVIADSKIFGDWVWIMYPKGREIKRITLPCRVFQAFDLLTEAKQVFNWK